MNEVKATLKKLNTKLVAVKDKLIKSIAPSKFTPVLNDTISRVVTLVSSTDFMKQVKNIDTIYVIKYDFDLKGETFELPKNCTLQFEGGTLKNGTLVGQDGIIIANRKIFTNVKVEGMWDCPGNVGWFASGNSVRDNQWGCAIPDLTDQSDDIQAALDSSFRELHFPPKCYYVEKTLVLTKEKKLILHGSDMKLNLGSSSIGKKNTCVIFTDKNICLFRIAVNESHQCAVWVEGGTFDVSKCEEYTENCIEVRADEEGQRLWGLTLNTNVKGSFSKTSGIGININPAENKELSGNKAYVTHVRINSNVSNFAVGVRANDFNDKKTMSAYNWCSDVVIDGAIINCPVCVEATCDCDIRAMLQSGKFFSTKENDTALIKIDTAYTCSVSSNIYDIRQGSGEQWSNEYAIEVVQNNVVAAEGHFRAFVAACNRFGWPVVKGKITF